MALIRRFEKHESERTTLHQEVPAKYAFFERDGRSFLQLDTYGRPDRKYPEKVSQSIQLDRNGAEQLYKILQQSFRFK